MWISTIDWSNSVLEAGCQQQLLADPPCKIVALTHHIHNTLETLKKAVSTTPVLRYYNLQEEVTLQCDASQSGLGTYSCHSCMSLSDWTSEAWVAFVAICLAHCLVVFVRSRPTADGLFQCVRCPSRRCRIQNAGTQTRWPTTPFQFEHIGFLLT